MQKVKFSSAERFSSCFSPAEPNVKFLIEIFLEQLNQIEFIVVTSDVRLKPIDRRKKGFSFHRFYLIQRAIKNVAIFTVNVSRRGQRSTFFVNGRLSSDSRHGSNCGTRNISSRFVKKKQFYSNWSMVLRRSRSQRVVFCFLVRRLTQLDVFSIQSVTLPLKRTEPRNSSFFPHFETNST